MFLQFLLCKVLFFITALRAPLNEMPSDGHFRMRVTATSKKFVYRVQTDFTKEYPQYRHSVSIWSGYDNDRLSRHREHVIAQERVNKNNATDLIHALISSDDVKVVVLVTRALKCVANRHDPNYTHPMTCGCRGCLTHIDLDTGVRVRSRDGKMHYICWDWKKTILELFSDLDDNKIFIRDMMNRISNKLNETH